MVLNNKPGVSSETRQAVLRAAEELGYRLPEHRPLRSAERRTLSIIYHIEEETRAEPYGVVPSILRGIRTFAREANVHLTILAGYPREGLSQILHKSGFSSDGLILMGPALRRDSESVVQALQTGVPVVALCRYWPDVPISTVGQNYHEQAGIALDHLVRLGHRKIAFIAGEVEQKYDWYQQRLDCYRKRMADLNGGVDEELIVLAKDRNEAVKTLMARRPDVTAIFANHDGRAIEAIEGLQAMELCVPQDVSVIGQDDARESPEGLPGLTTVRFSHFEVGYLAAEFLLKQIENKEIGRGNIWVRCHLVERESCSRPRAV